jgi:hypothetical protein
MLTIVNVRACGRSTRSLLSEEKPRRVNGVVVIAADFMAVHLFAS